MPKDTKTLGNSKARACESLGFVHKKGCARVLTQPLERLMILMFIMLPADLLGRMSIIELRPVQKRHCLMNFFVHDNVIFNKRDFLAIFVQEAFQSGRSL